MKLTGEFIISLYKRKCRQWKFLIDKKGKKKQIAKDIQDCMTMYSQSSGHISLVHVKMSQSCFRVAAIVSPLNIRSPQCRVHQRHHRIVIPRHRVGIVVMESMRQKIRRAMRIPMIFELIQTRSSRLLLLLLAHS